MPTTLLPIDGCRPIGGTHSATTLRPQYTTWTDSPTSHRRWHCQSLRSRSPPRTQTGLSAHPLRSGHGAGVWDRPHPSLCQTRPTKQATTGDLVDVLHQPPPLDGRSPYSYAFADLPRRARSHWAPNTAACWRPQERVHGHGHGHRRQRRHGLTQHFHLDGYGRPTSCRLPGINVRIDWGDASFYTNPNADVTGRITSGIQLRAAASGLPTRTPAASTVGGPSHLPTGQLTMASMTWRTRGQRPLNGLIRPGIRAQVRDGGHSHVDRRPGQHPHDVQG